MSSFGFAHLQDHVYLAHINLLSQMYHYIMLGIHHFINVCFDGFVVRSLSILIKLGWQINFVNLKLTGIHSPDRLTIILQCKYCVSAKETLAEHWLYLALTNYNNTHKKHQNIYIC